VERPSPLDVNVAGTSDREMVRQKEVYRRELEARRERRHQEKEKERTLMREIAKKRERSRSRERKKRRIEEEGDKTKDNTERSKYNITTLHCTALQPLPCLPLPGSPSLLCMEVLKID